MLATTHTPVLARMHWAGVGLLLRLLLQASNNYNLAKKRIFVGPPLEAPVAPSYVFVCETL